MQILFQDTKIFSLFLNIKTEIILTSKNLQFIITVSIKVIKRDQSIFPLCYTMFYNGEDSHAS